MAMAMAHLPDLVNPIIQCGFAAVIEQGGDAQGKQVLSAQTGEEVVLKDAEPADLQK